jgi:peptide/nickel transport system permease protein
MACVPELGAGRRRLEAIPGLPPAVNDLPPGCAFAPRCDRATGACRAGEIALERSGDRAVRCIHPVEQAEAAE